MNYTLIAVIIIMSCAAIFLSKVCKYPRNIWVLFISQPLVLCVSPVITFIGGLLASKIAPDPSLATLPLTTMIIGIAMGTFVVAILSTKFGRKKATTLGFINGIIATLIAMQAAITANFYLLVVAAFFLGVSLAFVQQLRFAALESVSTEQGPKVISALMLSGILAAFIGPEIALMGKDWIASPHGYAGSFLGLTVLIAIALVIFQLFTDPHVATKEVLKTPARSLTTIIKQPIFIIAMLAAAIGYGLMSFLMTATPISMHDMMGHSLEDTKWVLQSHITAMFLPSLLTGYLIKRFGSTAIMLTGTLMFALVAVIALQGQQVMHYWWALVLLGIGWNFLFITGTVLLPQSYQAHERYKIQATNDFAIFTIQAIASLSAGWLLFASSWHTLVYVSMPFVVIMLLICYWNFSTKEPVKMQQID